MRVLASFAAALTAFALAGGAAAQSGPPAALKPTSISGPGIYVRDLEAQKRWYQEKLGFSVARTINRAGKPYEHIMSLGNPADPAILALVESANRPAGPNAFSRVILRVPDARGLSAHLQAQGVSARELVPGVAYFISDPEGNSVELYTPRPAAPPAPRP